MAHPSAASRAIVTQRRLTIVAAAQKAGLFVGARGQVGARVSKHLLQAAKDKAGLDRTTDTIEYALARLALEDDFGESLLARKGRAPPELDLEF